MPEKAKMYQWAELPEEVVRPGVTRKGFRGEDVLLVMNTLQPGMQVHPHSHTFEQLVYILSGRTLMHVGDETHEMGPGSVMRIPPGVSHYAEPIGDQPVVNLDVFSPIREDYRHLVTYQDSDFGSSDT